MKNNPIDFSALCLVITLCLATIIVFWGLVRIVLEAIF